MEVGVDKDVNLWKQCTVLRTHNEDAGSYRMEKTLSDCFLSESGSAKGGFFGPSSVKWVGPI